MKDFCVVIQGPTKPNLLDKIRESWSGFPVIYSTWKGEEEYYLDEDEVWYTIPLVEPGYKNINYQKLSSINGFKRAKELGYRNVLKWRSDMYPTDAKGLVGLLKENMLNVYSFVNHQHGYFTDYFMAGDIDTMMKVFSFKADPPYPEYGFTKSILSHIPICDINIIGNKITQENDVIWRGGVSLYNQYKGPAFTNTIPTDIKSKYKL